MSESKLTYYTRPDNITVFEFGDVSSATVQHWVEVVNKHLDTMTEPAKRLYDLSQYASIPLMAVRAAMKLREHPNTRFSYTAVVTQGSRAASLVNTILSVTPGGSSRIFDNKEEAIAWLHEQVPDNDA